MQFCKILKLIKIGFIPHIYLVKSVQNSISSCSYPTDSQIANLLTLLPKDETRTVGTIMGSETPTEQVVIYNIKKNINSDTLEKGFGLDHIVFHPRSDWEKVQGDGSPKATVHGEIHSQWCRRLPADACSERKATTTAARRRVSWLDAGTHVNGYITYGWLTLGLLDHI
jgi:hypothetical protein